MVGYMVGNEVVRLRWRVAVKWNFKPYNRWYTSPDENFEYGYPLNDIVSLCLGTVKAGKQVGWVMMLLGDFLHIEVV